MRASNELPPKKAREVLRRFRRSSKPRKYHNHPVEVDGMRFDSLREAAYFKGLKVLKAQGHVKLFLRQVPFHLPGRTVYRCDFMLVWKEPAPYANPDFVDVKGIETETFRLKARMVLDLYGVKIRKV